MYYTRRLAILVCTLVAALPFVFWAVPKVLNPTPPTKEERARDAAWVASSPYWVDRQFCRWLSLCGLHHIHKDYASFRRAECGQPLELKRSLDCISDRNPVTKKRGTTNRGKGGRRNEHRDKVADKLERIPQYVLDHAPLVRLYSGENFWPSDIAEHVRHMSPVGLGGVPFNLTEPLTLNNLSNLDDIDELEDMVFLESVDDVEARPDWLHSRSNIPSPFPTDEDSEAGKDDIFETDPAADETSWFDIDDEHPLHGISDPRKLSKSSSRRDSRVVQRSRRSHRAQQDQEILTPAPPSTPMYKPDGRGYSKAPAVLVLVPKGPNILDAFWFFFYSYNLGQTVLGIRFGNHVGDWEHSMVRFEDGVPRAVFMSEHAGGQAYSWDAVEKKTVNVTTNDSDGKGGKKWRETKRPVLYSAVGSHAMYANPGDHPYILPFSLLRDQTDRGPMWDPSLNTYAYYYDYRVGINNTSPFQPSDLERSTSTSSDQRKAQEDGEKFLGDRGLLPTAENPNIPTDWFHFTGPWGDETYGLDDRRQYRLFGQYHYLTGPVGPKFKYLERHKVCQSEKCRILQKIRKGSTWY